MSFRRKGSMVPSLLGKGNISRKTYSMVSAFISHSVPVEVVLNQANVYSDTTGKIWLLTVGKYANRE